jgi:acyl-CoA reductase-like NAD-dependent aldehyde dehydrogenase
MDQIDRTTRAIFGENQRRLKHWARIQRAFAASAHLASAARPRDLAGRVWTNCFHAYPAHAAFGGYKQSGIGRETHKMMLDHYQQTKNLLVSYSPKKLGFF